jgi:hypothetical protein
MATPGAAACTHLMGDVRPRLTDVAAHFPHNADVVVAIEQVVLVLARTRSAARAMGCLVCLKGGIAQYHNKTLCVLVVVGDRRMLLRDQLRQLWWRHRLSSYRVNGHVSGATCGWWIERTVQCWTRLSTYLRASCPARASLGRRVARWATLL